MSTKFLPMQVSLGDAEYGETLPVAVILKISDTLRTRVADAVEQMRLKNLQTVILALEPDDSRWIRTLGYTSDNALSPIPGWMEEGDSIREPLDDVMNMDASDDEADYRPDCLVYDNPDRPAPNAGGLRLAREDPASPWPGGPSVCGIEFDLQMVFADWTVSTFVQRLDDLQDVFPGCAPTAPAAHPRERA